MATKTKRRNLDAKQMQRVADILKVIGHPVRLQVLEALEKEEPLTVNEIQDRIEIQTEQSLLSHHLIKMKDKGLLQSEKRGMNMYYSITDRSILKIFDCMENCDLI